MKKTKTNSIDNLIDKLASEFSKIPNFDLTQIDEDGNRLFNFIITKFSEIHDFKILHRRYFIPMTNKAIVDAKNALKTSFYRNIINVGESQLKENYYETIRLGYVGLFHKVENFVKGLLFEANLIYNDGKSGADSIEKYFEKKYKFKFTNWHSDKIAHKINWICNSVKHYDGYPKKEDEFEYSNRFPDNEKIKIDHDEFYQDIEYISNSFFQIKLSQILSFSSYKMVMDDSKENISDTDKAMLADIESKLKILM